MTFATLLSAVLIFCLLSDVLALCPSLPQPSNSDISSRSRTDGSYVHFRCFSGHQLVGSSTLVCNDGRWSDQIPKCLAICNPIRSIANGWVYGRGDLEGDMLRIRCRTDYILDGERLIKCTGNRRWNATKPTCRAPCATLGAPAHGRITQEGFRHNEDIKFECDPDYFLQGRNVVTCSDGTWNDVPPTCLASCSSLPRPTNGYKWGRSRTHGSYVRYFCSSGHKLVGSTKVVCNDGRWSDKIPECLAICYPIRSINNGWIYGRGYLEGDMLRFRCKNDYIFDGEQLIKCTGNRRWNATKPTCRAPCAKLGAPAYGRITLEGFRHNEDIKFECDPDYFLRGRNVLTCSDGTWNNFSPTCLAPCKRFGVDPFRGGYIKRDGYRHNEVVTFGCRDPLVIDGQATLRCNDGTWNNRLPTCASPCRKLAAPRNGVIIKAGYKHKETIIFGCKQGFQMVGAPDRICRFAVWNDFRIPRCEAKCPNPSENTNARVIGNEFYDGKEVEFVCPGGYILIPDISKKLTCENGRWEGIIPSCKASCPPLPEIPNGNIIIYSAKRRTHGSYALFSCNAAYHMNGTFIAMCNDGTWSEKLPSCLAICRRISSIKNGKVNGKGRLEGEEVSFVCDSNYMLDGEEVIKCSSTGKWNALEPVCTLQAPCKRFGVEPFRGGYIKRYGYRHNEKITFGCRDPLVIDGQDTLRCNDGTWNNRLPTCGGTMQPNVVEAGKLQN
ncbi:Hypothetical predicted protein [Paramuricea clavata]|uniref:Uncharacterized protein n=1 Tax=Paramuricea clavata TaxID=317549 RepID=A0A6S7I6P0_PARCT|nr:Hypothetical predicted protein [Paramuricea clavata]